MLRHAQNFPLSSMLFFYGFQKFTFGTLLIPTYREDNTALKTGRYYRRNIRLFSCGAAAQRGP
jgi:hypothetical protein